MDKMFQISRTQNEQERRRSNNPLIDKYVSILAYKNATLNINFDFIKHL